MSRREIVITIVGVLFILAGLVLNERVLAFFTSDGRIDSGGQLLFIRLFNAGCVGLGIALILLRKSQIVVKLITAGIITLVMFFALDILLYLSSPILPEPIVLAMSPSAQVRYYHANAGSLPWVYTENVRFAKPNVGVELFNIPIQADALGYRNPSGYLEEQGQIDVVLLGDSFIWGTEEKTIADFLREEANPLSVYSLGMAGSGISQWRYHYQRFASSPYYQEDPQIVVLNFYSGNDLTDTQVFLGLQQAKGKVDAADFYTYINYQYLIPTPDRSFSLPKFPEFLFLANYTYSSLRSPAPAANEDQFETTEGSPVCLKHREAYPEQFSQEILDELDLTVEAIEEISPDTEIVLSYIPTSSGIYGDLMSECPDRRDEVQRQEANSQLLAEVASDLGIHYVDFTPQLREHNQTEAVWSPIDHFSSEGYQFYATLLAGEIETLLSQE
jgi:lysophospholipase L1-like esterase